MQITTVEKFSQRPEADVVVVPYWKEKKGASAAAECKEVSSATELPLKVGDFHGKEGEILLLYCSSGAEKRVLLLGLGEQASCCRDRLRRAYAAAVKACRRRKVESVNFVLPKVKGMKPQEVACVVAEGVWLTNYAFDQLKSKSIHEERHPLLTKGCFVGCAQKSAGDLKSLSSVMDAVHYARDLVNRNADDVTPQTLAKEAKEMAKRFARIKTHVLDREKLQKEKMGLLLAVGQGAARDPALIVMEYQGDPKSKDVTAVVGKGITFDTGGLNLKPTGGMETMKCDMSGAAAVLGLMCAVASTGLKRNLIGVIATAENAIGSRSYKPGDVFFSRSGLSVEISNTDAEGRLVLADALSYVQDHYKITRMIDLATLTGGIVVALGEVATGLFSNDDKLAHALEKAAEVTSERVWRMPLYPEYKEELKSQIADCKNSGSRKASAGLGATFLCQFVKEKLPWAHLDIAGTAYLSEPRHYHPTHATGVGVRLLLEFLNLSQ